jgi:ketosteroid isomerase-like protein
VKSADVVRNFIEKVHSGRELDAVQVVDVISVTGKPLVELASAVYRVENGKIVEYWI